MVSKIYNEELGSSKKLTKVSSPVSIAVSNRVLFHLAGTFANASYVSSECTTGDWQWH
jgi:hypothetical protein